MNEIITKLNYYKLNNGQHFIMDNFEKIVLDSKCEELSYWFLDNIDKCNKQKHLDIIIASNNAEIMYKTFIIDESSQDIIRDIFIKQSNVEYCYQMLIDFPKKVLQHQIENIMIESKNSKYCYLLAKNVKGVDIDKLEQVVLDSKDIEYCYKFARDVKDADIKKHEKIILDSNNLDYILKFASDIPNIDIDPFAQKIIESKNVRYNYEFARDVKGADIKKHEKIILDSKNAQYIYLFAEQVPNCDYVILHDVLAKCPRNREWLRKFDIELKEDYELELVKQKILSFKKQGVEVNEI